MKKVKLNQKPRDARIGHVLQVYRFMYNLNIREMSKEIGISTATLSRIENGRGMDGKTLMKIMNWMFYEKC